VLKNSIHSSSNRCAVNHRCVASGDADIQFVAQEFRTEFELIHLLKKRIGMHQTGYQMTHAS